MWVLAALLALPRNASAQFANQTGNVAGTVGGACSSAANDYAWPNTNGAILKCVSNIWTLVTTPATAAGSTGYVQFNSSNALAGSANLFWNNGSGYLGIGTTAPFNLLDVNGAASIGYNVAAPSNGLIVAGMVGIGTTSPMDSLSVGDGIANDGAIIAQGYGTVGTSGQTLTLTGAGARMIWYPKKAAFRAGGVDTANPNDVSSAFWNDTNIGNYSAAFGDGCKASGVGSFCVGQYGAATGLDSFALGANFANASASNSIAIGAAASSNAANAVAIGYSASTYGTSALSLSTGGYTEASGKYSVALGYGAHTGSGYSGTGGDYSMAIGIGSTAATIPYVSGTYSLGIFMGDQGGAQVTASNVMAILGGSVGIGTTSPSSKLDINGAVMTECVTVSTLPTGKAGMRHCVTDATSCTFMATLTGSGSTNCPAYYNGSAWVAE